MAKKSLPDVSAKFIADVEGMIRDLKRADNATRSTAGSIDREVEKLGKSLKKKFSAGDIGKSVLQGLGLGSGFAVAQTAAEAVANYYQKAAESAKIIADLSDHTFAIFEKRMALGKTDEQINTENLTKQARLIERLAELDKPKIKEKVQVDQAGNLYTIQERIAQTKEEAETVAKLRDELEQVAYAIELYNQKEKEGVNKNGESDRSRRAKALAEGLKMQEEAYDALIRSQKEANDTTDETNKKAQALVDKYRDLADPVRQYRLQIEEVNKLHADGRLKAEEAAKAIERLQDAIFEARFGKPSEKPSDFDTNEAAEKYAKVVKAAKEMENELNQMWNSVSDRAGQAFADMVLTGEAAFSDLVNIVARAVLEMVARLAVINPILNALFGGMTGFGMLPAFYGGGAAGAGAATAKYAGAFAEGGTLEPGKWGMAGENGPEPIFAGSAPLTVIPNGNAGGGKGDTFHFEYHIGAGVTREQLMPILKIRERETIAKISDMRRRGIGGMAYA